MDLHGSIWVRVGLYESMCFEECTLVDADLCLFGRRVPPALRIDVQMSR
jgi:hypothetical protein